MDSIRRLSREIAAHPGLHDGVIDLCEPEQEAGVRVAAALVREHWDSAGAADTLVSVIRDSGAAISRPVTMSDALGVQSTRDARTAALCLLSIDDGRGIRRRRVRAPDIRSSASADARVAA